MRRRDRRAPTACTLPALVVAALAGVAAAQPADFDHDLTGFPLTGAHERVRCETCHVAGAFAGTPTACAACHDGSGVRAATSALASHIRTRADCADCHTSRRWSQVRMDHSVLDEPCETCHFGGALGMPVSHIASTQRCGDCHGTRRWDDVRFDHDAVSGSCSGCHDGVAATGKGGNHLVTSQECNVCHSTRRWEPARFDHSGVTGDCSSCHDGVTATGKDGDHLATNAECDLCHSTRRWTPASFDHGDVMGDCSSCHDGATATGKDPGHFNTMLECDTCHRTTAWRPDIYRHTGAYPGDHRQSLGCRDCHGGNSPAVTWPSPAYQPDCAGCHASDYRAGEDRHSNLSNDRNCGGSRCHSVSDREFDD